VNDHKQPSVVLFFIDGLGIGTKGPHNPLSNGTHSPLAHFVGEDAEIFRGGVLVRTDARLGVEGRPQSASGQSTILTGVNVPKTLGYHKQGFPNEQMREIIAEHSIFRQLDERAIGPNLFANTYTPQFFQTTPRWKSATTCAVEASSKMFFRRLSDLLGRKALFHDFTNATLRTRGFDISEFSTSDAAEILNGLASDHRFVLYEHFITDKIGHDQNFDKALEHLPLLAEFIRKVLELMDLESTTFILTSDHGNIEDLSVKNHTLNDIPTILWGRRAAEAAKDITDLSDITPTILKLLSE
jgi:2,3-bisphosphoglycerate-independent phosphoglycerate mutase